MKRKLIALAFAAGSSTMLFGLTSGVHAATCTSQQSTTGTDTIAATPAGTIYGAGNPPSGYAGLSGSSPAASGYIQASSTSGLTVYGTTPATPTPGGVNVNTTNPAASGQCP